jgi:hypothetical protein
MAITTYTELKSTIADFLNRDDLTAVIPTFISLAEAQMEREVRHYKMQKRSEGQIDTRYSQLPADFLEPVRFHLDDGYSTRLELLSLDDMLQYRMESADAQGKPRYYAMSGEAIEVFPTPDTTYSGELLYYAELEPLSDSNASNWLLEMSPDAYLYGALMQSAPYLKDDARMAVWSMLYSGAVAGTNLQSDKAKSGGSGLRLKIRSY